MIISTEEIVLEMKEAELGKELRSDTLMQKLLDKQDELFLETEIFNNAIDEKHREAFEKLDEQYFEYCETCQKEAFYYGFMLGLKLGQ